MKSKQFVIVLALLLVPSLTWAQATGNEADPEDFGTGAIGAPEAITPIPSFTVPVVELDFDLMPAGPTSVAAIQAQFPTAALADIILTAPTATPGVYNTNPNGRALGGDPGGGLNLELIDPPAGAFGAVGEIQVVLTEDVFEAGFGIGDWLGPFDVQVWDDGVQVGIFTLDTGVQSELFFASDVPFDEMRITALPAFPSANWVAYSIWIPEATVPTVPVWGLVLLAVALLSVSLLGIRRIRA